MYTIKEITPISYLERVSVAEGIYVKEMPNFVLHVHVDQEGALNLVLELTGEEDNEMFEFEQVFPYEKMPAATLALPLFFTYAKQQDKHPVDALEEMLAGVFTAVGKLDVEFAGGEVIFYLTIDSFTTQARVPKSEVKAWLTDETSAQFLNEDDE